MSAWIPQELYAKLQNIQDEVNNLAKQPNLKSKLSALKAKVDSLERDINQIVTRLPLLCFECGEELDPDEGDDITVYHHSDKSDSVSFCLDCLREYQTKGLITECQKCYDYFLTEMNGDRIYEDHVKMCRIA